MNVRAVILVALVMAGCSGGAPSASSTAQAAATPIAGVTPTPAHTPQAASYAGAQPASPAAPGLAGAITGRVSYPSEFLPPEAVYAITTDGRSYYRSETAYAQWTYTIAGVAPGDYVVYADSRMARDPDPTQPVDRFDAAYSRAVACGLSVDCPDHTAVVIHVSPGTTTPGVDVFDWYTDPSTMPLVPGNPSYPLMPRPAGFATPEAAAHYAGTTSGAKDVSVQAACDVNIACFALDPSVHLGQNAAYLTGTAGSNHDVLRCTYYEVHSGAGWEFVEERCGTAGQPVPVVGVTAHVYRSLAENAQTCVAVHDSPGPTTKTVACFTDGTEASIDGGPAYVQTTAADQYMPADVWWHLAGKGWVAQRNVYS